MADDAPVSQVRPHEQACSFCKKTRMQVLKLIAGDDVSICDECVLLCHEILLEDAHASPPPLARLERKRWFPRLFTKK